VPCRQRTITCARHLRIEAAIQYVVDGCSRRCRQSDPQGAEDQRVQRRPTRCSEKHSHHRCEHDEQDYSRLAELIEIAPTRVLLNGRGLHVEQLQAGEIFYRRGVRGRFYMPRALGPT
jgi:hypothetical protein